MLFSREETYVNFQSINLKISINMNPISIIVENLKCHGCAATITRELQKVEGVISVHVEVGPSRVDITTTGSEETLEACRRKLLSLGYPEAGSKNTTISKAKSYVSCAIGRMSE